MAPKHQRAQGNSQKCWEVHCQQLWRLGAGFCLVKVRQEGPVCECQGTCEDGEQLLLHGLSPSQEKGWERQGFWCCKAPAHSTAATQARLSAVTRAGTGWALRFQPRAITAEGTIQAWAEPVPALSQLSISVGLGSPGSVLPFLCPPARRFWPGTIWEPPGSVPQPCFLPLPGTAVPGDDSTSPEEPTLKLSRCYHPSSCRHLLCSQSWTLQPSQPLEKQTHALGACFRTDFPFPVQQSSLRAGLPARASCAHLFLSQGKCSWAAPGDRHWCQWQPQHRGCFGTDSLLWRQFILCRTDQSAGKHV